MINWNLYNRRVKKLAIAMTDVANSFRDATETHVTDVKVIRANVKAYDKASKAALRVCNECGVDFSSVLSITDDNYNDSMKNICLSTPTVACIMESCVMVESEVDENEAE